MSLYASVVNFSAKTSAGTQDITGDMGGGQPKAALFFMTHKTTASNFPSAPFHHTVGFTDGTNEFYMLARSDHGVTTTDDYKAAYTDAVLRGVDGSGAQDYKASFDSWVTDGVRIDWTDASPSGFQGLCILLGGSDLKNVHVGICGTDEDVTAPGFAANHVIVGAIGTAIANGTVESNFSAMFGMALDNSVFTNSTSDNLGWSLLGRDGLSSVQTSAVWEEACVISKMTDTGSTGFDYNMTVGGWDSSGFTTTSDVSNSDKVGYIAFEWASGCDVRLEPLDNNNYTTTGVNKFDYGADFGGTGTPVLEMLSGNGSRSNSGVRDNNDSGTLHYSATDGTNDYNVGGGMDDGVSTTATGSNAQTLSLGVPNIFNPRLSAIWIRATFDSWASDGVNHNFATQAGGSNFHYLGWVLVPSAATTYEESTGFDLDAGVTNTAAFVFDAAITGGMSAALTNGARMAMGAGADIGVNGDLTNGSSMAMGAGADIGVNGDLTSLALMVMQQGVTVGADGSLQTAGGLLYDESIGLLASPGVTNSASLTYELQASVAATTGYAAIGAVVFEAALNLNTQALQSLAVNLNMNVMLTVNAQSALGLQSQMAMQEQLIVAGNLGAAIAAVMTPGLQPGRTVTVAARGATLTVTRQARSIVVDARAGNINPKV